MKGHQKSFSYGGNLTEIALRTEKFLVQTRLCARSGSENQRYVLAACYLHRQFKLHQENISALEGLTKHYIKLKCGFYLSHVATCLR